MSDIPQQGGGHETNSRGLSFRNRTQEVFTQIGERVRQSERARRLMSRASERLFGAAVWLDAASLPSEQDDNKDEPSKVDEDMLPVKYEAPLEKLNMSCDPRLIDAMRSHAENIDVTDEEFVILAVRFEMMLHAIRETRDEEDEYDDTLRLVAINGEDATQSIRTFGDLYEEYGAVYRAYRSEEQAPMKLQFNEEQALTLHLAASSVYADELGVKTGDVTRNEYLQNIGPFIGNSLRHYMARIDMDAWGWTLYLDQNKGEDNMRPLDDIWEEGYGAAT